MATFDRTPLNQQLGLAALGFVMLSVSAGLTSLGVWQKRRWHEHTQRHHLVPAQLLVTELEGTEATMRDPISGLSGRPAAMLRTQQGTVPVDYRTGRTPLAPYQAHVMQMACYLYLLEATTSKAPAYGLLSYPGGVFRIEWNGDLRARLLETLHRMDLARSEGKADRDHQDRARCRGCARRDACSQKLV